jgi:hypothetical protein
MVGLRAESSRAGCASPNRFRFLANSLLAQEASAVTYNWDTNTLSVVGDGGTSVVQVTKSGQLIDSMTLAPGDSPQGTDFYDTEGIGDGESCARLPISRSAGVSRLPPSRNSSARSTANRLRRAAVR